MTGKHPPLNGEAVDVGSSRSGHSIATQLRPQIIDADKQDVWRCLIGQQENCGKKQEKGGKEKTFHGQGRNHPNGRADFKLSIEDKDHVQAVCLFLRATNSCSVARLELNSGNHCNSEIFRESRTPHDGSAW